VVLADDGVAPGSDACTTPFANAAAIAGKIALVDRGTCAFTIKVKNAQLNGAIAVIVANNVSGVITMSGADPTITIPALSVSLADGNTLKGQLAAGVNATLRLNVPPVIDTSYRWLMGEEVNPGGALRDMWNPTCYSNPGKVSDTKFYVCSTSDQGGVHTNSGIPNHAYALLVDGGTYNGHTVAPIGLTKAAAIYYRAQTVYQGPASDFADHADAIEQSCSDLIGATINDLVTGAPSADVINAADCAAVAEAAAAVELRTPPTFCNFQPMLAKNPPDRCAPGTNQVNMLFADFESGSAGWSTSHFGVTADFTPRDWAVVSSLPDRTGSGFFAEDYPGGTCAPGRAPSISTALPSRFPAASRIRCSRSITGSRPSSGGTAATSASASTADRGSWWRPPTSPTTTTTSSWCRPPAATPARSPASPDGPAPTAARWKARGAARTCASRTTRRRAAAFACASASARTAAAACSAGTWTT
jgi:hypothetical protein